MNSYSKNIQKNKGFTLVELLVVIVILAVLAGILVPALLGYIDRAKSAKTLLEAKEAYRDAQVSFIEYYARYEDDFKTYFKNQTSAGFYDESGKFHRASCITHWTLNSIQNWGSEARIQENMDKYKEQYESGINKKSYLLYSIALDLLRKDDSVFRKNAKHIYQAEKRASGMTYDEFAAMQTEGALENSNPLIYQLFFDENGKIVMFEYGADGYLIRFYDGEVTVESNGKTFVNK